MYSISIHFIIRPRLRPRSIPYINPLGKKRGTIQLREQILHQMIVHLSNCDVRVII